MRQTQRDTLAELTRMSQELGGYDDPYPMHEDKDAPENLWFRNPAGDLRYKCSNGYVLSVIKTVTGRGWRYDVLNTTDAEADCKFRSGYPTEEACRLACVAYCWRECIFDFPEWQPNGGIEKLTVGAITVEVCGTRWQSGSTVGYAVDAKGAAEGFLRSRLALGSD